MNMQVQNNGNKQTGSKNSEQTKQAFEQIELYYNQAGIKRTTLSELFSDINKAQEAYGQAGLDFGQDLSAYESGDVSRSNNTSISFFYNRNKVLDNLTRGLMASQSPNDFYNFVAYTQNIFEAATGKEESSPVLKELIGSAKRGLKDLNLDPTTKQQLENLLESNPQHAIYNPYLLEAAKNEIMKRAQLVAQVNGQSVQEDSFMGRVGQFGVAGAITTGSAAGLVLGQGMWDTTKNGNGAFNINAIFDGKTSIDELAQKMVNYNDQYGLPPELVDKSAQETKIAPNLTADALKPMVEKLGFMPQEQINPQTQQKVLVDVPIVFRMENGKPKPSSVRDNEAIHDFLKAVYPDQDPHDVLADKDLVDDAGTLNKQAFYDTVLSDLSKKTQEELVETKKGLDEMGLGSVLSEKTFYKGFTKEEYKAAIMRYLQQLDSYREHFQENLNPLRAPGSADLDSEILSSFGDLYPEYKGQDE